MSQHLLFLLLFPVSCFAQQTDAEIKERIDKYLEQKRSTGARMFNPIVPPRINTIELKLDRYWNAEARSPGVYALPEGGMPCLVPNQQSVVPITNTVTTTILPFEGAIPNAWNSKGSPEPFRLNNNKPLAR